MKYVEEIDRTLLARELTALGVRPPMVVSLADVRLADAIRLYSEIHEQTPPRGMLPSSPEWYFVTRRRRKDAAAFLSIYVESKNCMRDACRARHLIASWKVFSEISKTPLFDINRAWSLITLHEQGKINLMKTSTSELPFYNNYDIT